ncbi:MAG TPA: hypothetical protein VK672_03000 [Solirubrobacteraceae bacterium]|jgi:hypothetical protein|nr:hypothetical protein [Solirubrobacteraceae bacterium]
MRFAARILLTTVLGCAIGVLTASSAPASFGVSKWEAGTCTASGCTAATPEQFYTQAGGHPPYGITDFRFNTSGSSGMEAPEGNVKEVRVDIPPGLSVDPFATPQCKLSELEGAGCPPDTQVGEVQLTAHLNLVPLLGHPIGATITPPNTPVYNMVPPPGKPLEAAFKVALFETVVHIVGGIETTGYYHEFFTIKEIPTTPELVESRLIFFGTALGPGGTLPFITMPSTCLGPQTTLLHVVSYQGQEESKSFTTPVGASGCDKVPFAPSVKVTPTTTAQSDRSSAVTVKVEVPQPSEAPIDSSMLEDARVALPEGMTLNPAAASGLQACTDEGFAKHSTSPVNCPPGSQVGTGTIETPDLPPGSLTGPVYVAQPTSSDPGSGNEYRIFIDAEAPIYGVSVRLEGHVSADANTGRLTTAVLENPQVPFSDFVVHLEAGPRTPLANPLVCGPATTNASLLPYSGTPAANPFAAFPVDFDGRGASCPSPLPFNLGQSLSSTPTAGGGNTGIAFALTRGEGQQYPSRLTATLPAGLVAKIPAVTPCGEPQARQGDCTPASQIGTATVSLGSGPSPLALSGSVYFTGPYAGAPYGLSVVVPAEKIGPYNYGRIVTRATIDVDPFSSRVIVSSQLPTIVGGVPLRLRTLDVSVNRPDFALNPTSCSPLDASTTLTSTLGTTQSLSSPFQATGCDALAFKPKLTASTSSKASRARGASLVVRMHMPGGLQANIRSVLVALPRHLPSRLSTLAQACTQAVFSASPSACPPGSRVGTATVKTPVLPGKLTGPAIFVSHGGAAFPDLDLVLSGDGVTVILVGNTNIAKGITTSDFATLPDVSVSSVEVRLPAAKNSALAANGKLCKQRLLMPTTITAQNGKQVRLKTRISVIGCPRKHRRHHHRQGHRRHAGRRILRKASH